MKKTILVKIEKEVEVEIPDHLLHAEALKEFSDYMFEVDKPEEILEFAARALAQYESSFLDGVGSVVPYWENGETRQKAAVIYREVSCEVESEILED